MVSYDSIHDGSCGSLSVRNLLLLLLADRHSFHRYLSLRDKKGDINMFFIVKVYT